MPESYRRVDEAEAKHIILEGDGVIVAGFTVDDPAVRRRMMSNQPNMFVHIAGQTIFIVQVANYGEIATLKSLLAANYPVTFLGLYAIPE